MVYNNVVTIDEDILGGEPVFKNTRVPIKFFFEYINDGCSIDDFIEQYPSVSKEITEAL